MKNNIIPNRKTTTKASIFSNDKANHYKQTMKNFHNLII